MKIAVELSGHLRTCVAIPSILSRFNGHRIDWYIHTYSNDLYETNKLENETEFETKNFDLENIYKLIKPIAIEVENNEDVLGEIIELVKELKPKNKYDNSRSVLSMWRKRLKCSELRKQFGNSYELVIVTRPDLYWHKSRFFDPGFLSKKPYIPYEYGYGVASDVAAIGNENFIEKYSSLYLQIKDLYYKNNKDINPHKILEKYLENFDYSKKIMGVTIIRPSGNKSPHLGLSGRKEKFIRELLFIGCNSEISLKKILKLIFNKIFNFIFLKLNKLYSKFDID